MPILGIVLLLSGSAMATAAVFVVARLVPVARRKAHNDILGYVYAEIGVIYAVVLAMVVVGVWETRSQAHENTYTETNALLQLTWYSSSLPQPDRTRLGTLVERYTGTVIDDEWPLLAEQRDDPAAWRQFTEIRSLVNTQEPATGADQVRYQGALEAVAQLGDARRERVNEAATAGVPALLWTALLLGALVTVGFVYLFGVESLRAHAGVVFSLTFIVGVMLLIVYEFDYPFSGPLKVNPTAFQLALERMRSIN
ncbi:bestrophin-like domain [Streptomyces sp. NPDC000878]